MPMLISTLATTRSMTRNGTNSRNPIWNARFSSEIMKAGVTMRMGVSIALAGTGILESLMNRPRSSRPTCESMKVFTGLLAAVNAAGSSILWSSSGLTPWS